MDLRRYWLQRAILEHHMTHQCATETFVDELLKVYDLDLKECLCLCRVRELSKELKRATEAAESINAVQKQKQEGKPKRKHKIKCSYCKSIKA